MGETRKIALTVNGKRYEEEVEVRVTLADFVRHQLGLTGTHLGCEHGVCGACTILLDGRSARSCLMLAVQAHEHEITTVEGLGSVTDWIALSRYAQPWVAFRFWSMENFTSADVNSWPVENFTPGRSVNV